MLSSHVHRRKGLVHFVRIRDTLSELIPQLEGAVSRTGEEFVVASPAYPIDGVRVGRFRLEISLFHVDVWVHLSCRLGALVLLLIRAV